MGLGSSGEVGVGLIEAVERSGKQPEVEGDCAIRPRVGEHELVAVGGEQSVQG
jgi:hypothetical protein